MAAGRGMHGNPSGVRGRFHAGPTGEDPPPEAIRGRSGGGMPPPVAPLSPGNLPPARG